MAKYIDPVKFGIPLVYLTGPEKQDEQVDEEVSARSSPIKGESINIRADLASLCDDFTPVHFLERSTHLIGKPSVSLDGSNKDESLQSMHYGLPYWRVSKLLSMLTSITNPKELCNLILLSVKWLMKEAVSISQKKDFLGADTVFPILVLSLVYADIPNIHLLLQYLHDYGEVSDAGEISYYITCLEAAVEYIIGLEVAPEIVEGVRRTIAEGVFPRTKA